MSNGMKAAIVLGIPALVGCMIGIDIGETFRKYKDADLLKSVMDEYDMHFDDFIDDPKDEKDKNKLKKLTRNTLATGVRCIYRH